MRHTPRQGLFPWFSIFTGLIGFALRCWLFSTTDDRGLLPQNHIASILSVVLLLLTLGICFYWLLQTPPQKKRKNLFPRSPIAACGNVIGAAGIAYSTFTTPSMGFFQYITPVLGVLASFALLYAGWCRLKDLQAHYLSHSVVTVYLMFHIVQHCRIWSAEPRLQIYLFPLLAAVFLLLACFYHTELDKHTGNLRRYFFCNQAAVFCCILAAAGSDPLYYVTSCIWMATDLCAISVSDPS